MEGVRQVMRNTDIREGRESYSEIQKYGGGERAIVRLRNNGGSAKVILKYRGE